MSQNSSPSSVIKPKKGDKSRLKPTIHSWRFQTYARRVFLAMTKITNNFDGIQPGKPYRITWDPTPRNVSMKLGPHDGSFPIAAGMQVGPDNIDGATGSFVWDVPSDLLVNMVFDLSIIEAGSRGGWSSAAFSFNDRTPPDTFVTTTLVDTPNTHTSIDNPTTSSIPTSSSSTFITSTSSTQPSLSLASTINPTLACIACVVSYNTDSSIRLNSDCVTTTFNCPTLSYTFSDSSTSRPSSTTNTAVTLLTGQGTSTPVISTASSAPTTTPETTKETFGPGTKAGIGIGVFVGAIAIIALASLLHRSRKFIGTKMGEILLTKRNPEFGESSTTVPPYAETYYGAGESVETPSKGEKKGLFKH